MNATLKSSLVSAEVLSSLQTIVDTIMSESAITTVTPKVDAAGEETGEYSARVNTLNLEVLLELLTAEKKSAKSVDESLALQDKEKAKAAATLEGASKAKAMKVGDKVTFTMGSGKAKREFTRIIEKMSDKTFTVSFDDAYLCTTSVSAPTGKKHIKFSAIVSFESVAVEAVA